MKEDARIDTQTSQAATEAALAEMRDVVGAEHVLTGADAGAFRDPYWPADWEQFEPIAVVQPASRDEVQGLLKIANAMRVPIWVNSRGMNKGYGGAAPRTAGCVVVNLQRMNRVLEINTELGYAVVEPGVSFMQLYNALKAGGHPWLGPTPDLAEGSVIGNSLENGVIYGPLAADQQIFCGMEVVLPNGDVMRTGMGALPGSETFHLYKRGFGPAVDHLFLQSNYGIVTQMGVWLLPRPKTFHWFNVTMPGDRDIGPMIDVLRRLRLERVLEGVPRLYNTAVVASIIGPKAGFWPDPSPIPEEVLDEMGKAFEMGRWMCHCGFWEDEGIVARKLEICQEAFEAIGATFVAQSWPYDDIENCPLPPDRVMALQPEPTALDVVGWPLTGIGGHTTNGLVIPATSEHALKAHDLARGIFEGEFGFDYMGVNMLISPRCYIQLSLVVYDKTNPEETERAYKASRKLIEEGAKLGYLDYRAHVYNMDTVSDLLSEGGHALPRLLNTIKDALDPEGILAPGKQGIWPRAYR